MSYLSILTLAWRRTAWGDCLAVACPVPGPFRCGRALGKRRDERLDIAESRCFKRNIHDLAELIHSQSANPGREVRGQRAKAARQDVQEHFHLPLLDALLKDLGVPG